MSFEIMFNDSPKNLIDKIRKVATENNGKFTGDENTGEIEISTPAGKIHAAYKVENQLANIEILEKPFFLSEEMIKGQIVKLLS